LGQDGTYQGLSSVHGRKTPLRSYRNIYQKLSWNKHAWQKLDAVHAGKEYPKAIGSLAFNLWENRCLITTFDEVLACIYHLSAKCSIYTSRVLKVLAIPARVDPIPVQMF